MNSIGIVLLNENMDIITFQIGFTGLTVQWKTIIVKLYVSDNVCNK